MTGEYQTRIPDYRSQCGHGYCEPGVPQYEMQRALSLFQISVIDMDSIIYTDADYAGNHNDVEEIQYKLIGLQNKLRVMFDWALELFFKRDTSQV